MEQQYPVVLPGRAPLRELDILVLEGHVSMTDCHQVDYWSVSVGKCRYWCEMGWKLKGLQCDVTKNVRACMANSRFSKIPNVSKGRGAQFEWVRPQVYFTGSILMIGSIYKYNGSAQRQKAFMKPANRVGRVQDIISNTRNDVCENPPRGSGSSHVVWRLVVCAMISRMPTSVHR